MARFFFNLHEGGLVLTDEEGAEMPSVDAARANALREGRHLMAADVSKGVLCLDCHIAVQDDKRTELLIVAFKDAIALSCV